MNEEHLPYLGAHMGKSGLANGMAGGSKNGFLDTRKLTRQRLGFAGEEVRGKEDGAENSCLYEN